MRSGRLRILLSAYACAPGRGSEPGVGWNAAVSLARHHDVWVLTQDEARTEIERVLRSDPVPGLTVSFVDLPGTLYRRKLDDGLIQLYYARWQRAVLATARRLHEHVGFDVVHHVTLGKYWQASHLWKLGLPFVLGPVGGAESAPPTFRAGYGWRGRGYELARDAARWYGDRSPAVSQMVTNTAACLTSTHCTAQRLDALGSRNTIMIPGQTGLTAQDLDMLRSLPACDPAVPRFVIISRLLHWKGLHLAIDALRASEHPDAQLWIVGEGPERLRLERQARRLGLLERVRFWGTLPRSRTLEILAGSTALIHPSLHDFSPTVVLEAMGAGKPVIALDLSGPAAQIPPGSGLLVSARTPGEAIAGMAGAMNRLASDEALRTRITAEARHVAEEQYSWERKAELFSGIYDDIVGTRARRAVAEAMV